MVGPEHTQAIHGSAVGPEHIENRIGLTKKRTNYREKGGPVRKQDLAATADPTRRIVSRTSLPRKIGSASVALPKQPVSTSLGSSTLRRDSTVDGG